MNDETQRTGQTSAHGEPLSPDQPATSMPEGAAVASTTAAAKSEDNTKAMAVYVLHLAGLVTGGLTSLIGLILAYVFKGDADAVTKSHYDNAIGIFWKALLYSIPCFILTFVVIGILMYIALAVWFIVRCAKGLQYLSRNEPYPNPRSWGF